MRKEKLFKTQTQTHRHTHRHTHTHMHGAGGSSFTECFRENKLDRSEGGISQRMRRNHKIRTCC